MREALLAEIEKDRGLILIGEPEPIPYKIMPRMADIWVSPEIKPYKQGNGTNLQKKKARKKKKRR